MQIFYQPEIIFQTFLYRKLGFLSEKLWKIRKSLIILIYVYMFLFFHICTAEENSDKKNNPLPDSVSLQLKWHHQFQFAGYYAAKEKGYYREAGLDVKLNEGGPFDTVDEVIEHRSNFGASNAEILLQRLQGKPVVVLAAILQHSPQAFMVRKDSNITSPQNFIGRCVWMALKTRTVELQATLINEGIPLNKIKMLGDATRPGYLFDNTIDAFGVYTTNEPFLWKEKGIPFTIIHPISYGIDFYGDCLYTSEKELREHPGRVKQFREASLRGWEYAMEHPEEIADLILAKYGSKKTREHLLYEAEKIRELILPDLIEMGQMNPGRWQHIADTFVQLKMAEPGYSLDGFIYDPESQPHWFKHAIFYWMFGFLCLAVLCLILLTGFNRALKKAVRQRTLDLIRLNENLEKEIQERKQTEKALEESSSRLQALFDNAMDAIMIADDNARYVDVNPAACQLSGYIREEILQLSVLDMTPTPDREIGQKLWRAFISGKRQSGEYSFIRKDGTIVETEYQATANFIPGIHLSVIRDITDRKLAENALRESEDKYRTLFNMSKDAIFLYNIDSDTGIPGKFIDANETALKWLEYSKEELLSLTPLDIRDPDFQYDFKTLRERMVQQKCYIFEIQLFSKTGKKIPLEINSHAFDYKGKRITIVIGRNIKERKQAEEALRQEREKAEQYFDVANVMLLVLGADQRVVQSNQLGTEI